MTINVAPLVGAWIEIRNVGIRKQTDVSLPLWERGLKYLCVNNISKRWDVAPLVGAWIEIIVRMKQRL